MRIVAFLTLSLTVISFAPLFGLNGAGVPPAKAKTEKQNGHKDGMSQYVSSSGFSGRSPVAHSVETDTTTATGKAETHIEGFYRNGKVEFLWTHNLQGRPCVYILQRSEDMETFENVSTQKSSGSNLGDIFFDVDPQYRNFGDKKYYRVKVIQGGGVVYYSEIIRV